VVDRPPCPRCGTTRLISRIDVLTQPQGGEIPLGLYVRYRLACRRVPHVIVRHQYLCELCTHRWVTYTLKEEQT
jgi:hypothetical protein